MVADLVDRLIARALRRRPDFVIGGSERPYLLRWWLIPRNRLLNVYLHCFLRSDDDRALHDHPWSSVSVILRGHYLEHTKQGVHKRVPGRIVIRPSGRMAHRVELDAVASPTCWTLFITGPRYREWGFLCPQGWVHWRAFTRSDDPGQVGPGCSQ